MSSMRIGDMSPNHGTSTTRINEMRNDIFEENYATKKDFGRAPVGHPFLEACGCCGQGTGVIMLKKRGTTTTQAKGYIPRYMINPDSRCEFCDFLGRWMAHENIDPKETGLKYGMAKFVTVDEKSGIETLLAYCPFSSDDDVNKELKDGTPFTMKHGTVVQVDDMSEEEGHFLVKVLKPGV